MNTLSYTIAIPLLEGLSCALLGAAAATRARNFGAHLSGAIVLGCLCGLLGPLLRETFLHGAVGSSIVARTLPAEALIGSVGGVAALSLASRFSHQIFLGLDSVSIGMATSLGAVLCLQELGITGALAIGLVNGLAPGLVRDMALGDTAMLVDRDWYATAAAIGAIVAIAAELWLSVGWSGEWAAANPDVVSVCAGFLTAFAIIFSVPAKIKPMK